MFSRLSKSTTLCLATGVVLVSSPVWTGYVDWPISITSWLHTCSIAICSSLIASLVGACWAFDCEISTSRIRRLWVTLMLGWLALPPFLQVAAWRGGIGRLGWMVQTGDLNLPLFEGTSAAIFMHAYVAIPWAFFLNRLLMRGLPQQQMDLALQLEGLLAVFLACLLPNVKSAFAVLLVFNTCYVATDMMVTDLYGVDTLARQLYNGLAFDDSLLANWLHGTLLTMFISVLIFFTLTWVERQELWRTKISSNQSLRAYLVSENILPLRLGIAAFRVLVIFAIGIPIINLVYKAGRTAVLVDESYEVSWSAAKCVQIMARVPIKFYEDIIGSLALATLAATICLVIAFVATWRFRVHASFVPRFLLAMVLAVPLPFVALTIIHLLSQYESVVGSAPQSVLNWLYDRTLFAPVVALSFRVLPVMTFLFWWHWNRLPRRAMDVTSLAGVGMLQFHRDITLGSTTRICLLTWLAGVLVVLADVAASILVVNPGFSTLAIRIFDMLHAGVTDEVAGICLCAMFGTFLVSQVLLILLPRE